MKKVFGINKSKRIVSAMLVAMVLCTGMFSSVFAGNIEDKDYEFHSTNVSGNTQWEYKDNTTKVYVYPSSGPELYFTVRGATDRYGANEINASGTHRISNGTQGSITNSVREKGKSWARLHMQRTTYANTMSYGVWSPDSSRNYTIFG